MADNSKKNDDSKKTNDKVNTDTSEKNNGPLRGSGLEQHEKASLAQEGPGGEPNKAGWTTGKAPDQENTSPLADQIEQEKLDQYKKAEEDRENGNA